MSHFQDKTMHLLRASATVLIIVSAAGESVAQEQIDSVADPAATIVEACARFTVLTPGLVRLEWSPDGKFEDRASQVFVNRRLPVPKFSKGDRQGYLTISTEKFDIRYKRGGGRFDKSNLVVLAKTGPGETVWELSPPFENRANLGGTTRTLDGVSGACALEPGLLSQNGWTWIDDSDRLLFDKTGWIVPRNSPPAEEDPKSKIQNPKSIDWYFLVYGRDYKAALADYIKVAGRVPLPPRFAFGAWWSRYWAYSADELKQLVKEFREHDVPLDVLVIDMDWHRDGWTGYTWNPKYFPDPEGFLKWVHEQGLKVTLNLHPAEGVGRHEAQFPAMCKAMGLDPAKTERIPFDCTDRRYVTAYFDVLHHPLERQGVDFWWIDWQQGKKTSIPGLDPLWWLNYLHWTDMERRCATAVSAVGPDGETAPTSEHGSQSRGTSSFPRPIIFSRWGGLGNHRYQIGFSGDTYCNWPSLAFQPYFTSTAGNVGYAYWSHDIGGHQPGKVDPELYVRWLQWGALSPILRTHTTKNPEAERRIWAFPTAYFEAARKAYHLRYELIPYIYTAARQCYDTGVPICRPLYYEWPDESEAYRHDGEYMFGDQMLVAPVTEPADPVSGCAMVEVWLPPGRWTNWFTGRTYEGPKTVPLVVPLDEIPMFVKSGGIIVTQPKMAYLDEKPADKLIINIFPGESGGTRFYEDDGRSVGYASCECTWTPISHKFVGKNRIVSIGPSQGTHSGQSPKRRYELRFYDKAFDSGTFVLNGKLLKELHDPNDPKDPRDDTVGPWYYGTTMGEWLPLPPVSTSKCATIEARPLTPEQMEGWRKDTGYAVQVSSLPNGFRGLYQLLWMAREPGDVALLRTPPYLRENSTKTRQLALGTLAGAQKSYFMITGYFPNWPDSMLGRWLEIASAINDSKLDEAHRLSLLIRFLGLFYKMSISSGDADGRTFNAECRLAPTLGVPAFEKLEGMIRFLPDGQATLTGNRKRAFQGLSEDNPILLTTKIENKDALQTTRYRAEIEITTKGLNFTIPLEKVVLPSINAWWILGPFDAKFEGALAKPFPPEKLVDLKATYDRADQSRDREGAGTSRTGGPSGSGADRLLTRAAPMGEKIAWRHFKRQIKPGNDLTGEFFVDFDDVFGKRIYDGVVYGFTWLESPEDLDAVLAVGSDDGCAIRLNNKEVHRIDIDRPYTSKSERVPVTIRKGLNTLLIKVAQRGGDGGFCVHIEDKDGTPLTQVKPILERPERE
jgi:alpha-glucosidase